MALPPISPLPPVIRILLAIEAALKTVDYSPAALGAAVTIRHSRNRKAVRGEKPAVTIIFVGDDPQAGQVDRNMWESVREMVVDLQFDLHTDTEDSGGDPTGLGDLWAVDALSLRALKAPDQPVFLGGLADWISAGSIDPEDRSQPDEGRMTRALTVLYRVRSDDVNVLLAQGENG